ncbi:acyl-CoA dehydrogenase family protein [Pseudactinotalea sp.]|uniref:acyl-CoA dehydrogenase family protein n=1 Tax=Pseudactinotalea sp. TaxID=1926260 RepID=UPI003B3BE854
MTTDDAVVLAALDTWCEQRLPELGQDFFPTALVELAELGLQSLLVTGTDLDLSRGRLAHETSERLARALPALAVSTSVARLHAYLLVKYAVPHVRDRWLADTLAARAFGGFALTEPHAGTDVRALSTVAVRDGDDYLLTGDKCWVGLAPVSDYVIVLAKEGHDGRDAPTVALVVDMALPGASGAHGPALSGLAGMPNGTLTFRDVRVPADHALDCDGFLGMMDGLNLARIEAASYSCGIMHRALELAATRASTREAFGKPLAALPSIQAKLGRMWTDYRAARELTLVAVDSFAAGDGGDRDLISMAKLFASDASRRHTDEAMQVFGAQGLAAESEVLRLHNDAKVMQIFDGTSEIHETMLGRRAAKEMSA